MNDTMRVPRRVPLRGAMIGWVALTMLPLLGGCSSSPAKPPPPTTEIDRQKLCGDKQWKEQHAGLWFDLCPSNAMNGN